MTAPHPLASFVQLIMAHHDTVARDQDEHDWPRRAPRRPAPSTHDTPAEPVAPATAPTAAPAPAPVPVAAPTAQPVLPRQIDLERARRIRA
jgi:hypothetical protein